MRRAADGRARGAGRARRGARAPGWLALTATLIVAQAAPAAQATPAAPERAPLELTRPPGAPAPEAAAPLPDLSGFTVDAVRAMVPQSPSGRTARLASVDDLYFLHRSNVVEMNRVWKSGTADPPTVIVLGRGSYRLESVRRQIDDPAVLSRGADGSYLLSRPIYIAPTATLALSEGDRLRLATGAGTFVYSHGTLIVVDGEITAWDEQRDAPSSREALDEDTLLLYADQRPRPYILASEGSRTFLAASTFRGLGYKGTSGTFGISFTPSASGGRLARHLERLPAPTGWLIGNRIEDLFFGFYSHRADDVAMLGNLFSDNVVYAIDPHDYSRRLIVADNVTQGSGFAHGIIFSRGVSDSWVVGNLTIANAGSGIMMDRSSTDNLIADNLVVANDGDGIAVFESDRNLVRGNAVLRNARNGILVRNSADVAVVDNTVAANGRSGMELASADISSLETRDFSIDPFHRHASARVEGNEFRDNVRSAVSMRDAVGLTLHANRYPASAPLYFDGDLAALATELLAAELGRTTPVRVVRRGAASAPRAGQHEQGAAPAAPRVPNPLLEEHAGRGVPLAMLGLARFYTRERDDAASWERGVYWYGRAIRHARVSAMSELGIALVTRARSAAERREGLVLLAMAAHFGDEGARQDLALLPDVLGTPDAALRAARLQAQQRIRSETLWNAQAFPGLRIEFERDEMIEAHRRVRRLLREGRAVEPKNPPRLSGAQRERYRARIDEKNAKRAKLNERRREQRLADARAVGERRAHLDRVARRERSAQLRVARYTEAEWHALRDRVIAVLERVNRHRAADDPVRLDAILMPERAAVDR